MDGRRYSCCPAIMSGPKTAEVAVGFIVLLLRS